MSPPASGLSLPSWFTTFITLSVAVLGGLGAGVWRASAAVTEMSVEVSHLRETMQETVKPAILQLANHEIRISVIESQEKSERHHEFQAKAEAAPAPGVAPGPAAEASPPSMQASPR